MTPTVELRTTLRRALDEAIPTNGTADSTRFSDAEIDELLAEAASLPAAAAEGWTRKAARAMSERGGLEENQAGDQKLKFVSIGEYRDHCLAMARLYADRVAGAGSRALELDPPDVLGTTATAADVSRLLGYDT